MLNVTSDNPNCDTGMRPIREHLINLPIYSLMTAIRGHLYLESLPDYNPCVPYKNINFDPSMYK